MRRLLRRCILLASLPLLAEAEDAILPPPGLYRVDTGATLAPHGDAGPALRLQRDGAGGVTHASGRRADGSLYRRSFPDADKPTYCIAPQAAATPLPPGKGCISGPGERDGNATRFVARCPGMEVTTTVRRTGPTTWEYRIRTVQGAASGGASTAGVERMQAMLAYVARYGATPQERAAAARELAVCDARARTMQAPSARAGAPAKVVTTIQALTRIADRCTN